MKKKEIFLEQFSSQASIARAVFYYNAIECASLARAVSKTCCAREKESKRERETERENERDRKKNRKRKKQKEK